MDSNNSPEIQKTSINTIKLLLVTAIALMVFFVIGFSYVSAGSQARDKVRVKDIELIQKFLKAHKINEGVYPISVNGKPGNWQRYLQNLPVAPQADGNCSKEMNDYTYKNINSGQDFSLSFCLKSRQGDYRAGLNTITSKN